MKKLIATLFLSIFYILPVRAIDITNGSLLSNYWINSSTSYIMDLTQDIRDARAMMLTNAALGKILFGGGHTINAYNGSALFFYRPTTTTTNSKGHLFFADMTLNGGVVRTSTQLGGAAFASWLNPQTATAINSSGIGHKFQNVKFTNNTAMTANGVFGGGAIYAGINTANTSITNSRNIFDFTNVSFYNNTGTEGGAILGTAGSEFNFSGFNYIGGTEQGTGNFAVSNGGGIHLTNRGYHLQNTQPGIDAILNSTGHIIFENNHANDRGGAIFAHGATINLENARFINNRASAGGGIFIEPLVNVSNVLKSGILNIKQTDIHRDGLFIGNHGGAIAYTNRVEITFDTDADTNIRVYDDIWNTGQYFGDSSFTKKGEGNLYLGGNVEMQNTNFLINDGNVYFNGDNPQNIIFKNLTISRGRFDTTQTTHFTAPFIENLLDLSPDSILALKVSETDNDRLEIYNQANLDGRLEIQVAVGTYDNYRGEIIYAQNGVNGTFASNNSTDPIYTLDYSDPDRVFVVIDNAVVVSHLADIAGLSFNQLQIAQMLDDLSGTSSGDLSNVITELQNMNSDESKIMGLNQISPHFVANNITAMLNKGEIKDVYDVINDQRMDRDFWFDFSGGVHRLNKDKNSVEKFKANSYAGTFGYSEWFGHGVVGAYGRYQYKEMSQGSASAELHSGSVGLYGGYIGRELAVKSVINAAYNYYSHDRDIHYGSISRTASTDFYALSANADVQAEYKFHLNTHVDFKPFVGASVGIVNIPDFTETGANSLNLEYNGDIYKTADGRAGLGLGIAYGSFALDLDAAYKFVFTGYAPEITATLQHQDQTFIARGLEFGRHQFVGSANALYHLSHRLNLSAKTSYTIGDNISDIYFGAGIKVKF